VLSEIIEVTDAMMMLELGIPVFESSDEYREAVMLLLFFSDEASRIGK